MDNPSNLPFSFTAFLQAPLQYASIVPLSPPSSSPQSPITLSLSSLSNSPPQIVLPLTPTPPPVSITNSRKKKTPPIVNVEEDTITTFIDGSQQMIKRPKVDMACVVCRKKKIKCDGKLPCTYCKDKDAAGCKYADPKKRGPTAASAKKVLTSSSSSYPQGEGLAMVTSSHNGGNHGDTQTFASLASLFSTEKMELKFAITEYLSMYMNYSNINLPLCELPNLRNPKSLQQKAQAYIAIARMALMCGDSTQACIIIKEVRKLIGCFFDEYTLDSAVAMCMMSCYYDSVCDMKNSAHYAAMAYSCARMLTSSSKRNLVYCAMGTYSVIHDPGISIYSAVELMKPALLAWGSKSHNMKYITNITNSPMSNHHNSNLPISKKIYTATVPDADDNTTGQIAGVQDGDEYRFPLLQLHCCIVKVLNFVEKKLLIEFDAYGIVNFNMSAEMRDNLWPSLVDWDESLQTQAVNEISRKHFAFLIKLLSTTVEWRSGNYESAKKLAFECVGMCVSANDSSVYFSYFSDNCRVIMSLLAVLTCALHFFKEDGCCDFLIRFFDKKCGQFLYFNKKLLSFIHTYRQTPSTYQPTTETATPYFPTNSTTTDTTPPTTTTSPTTSPTTETTTTPPTEPTATTPPVADTIINIPGVDVTDTNNYYSTNAQPVELATPQQEGVTGGVNFDFLDVDSFISEFL